jgi:hypothetical protein
MEGGSFVTLETEVRFDPWTHLAEFSDQVRAARDAGFESP